MNYRIVFLFLLAVSVTSTVLLFSMDLYIQIYDPDWYGILNSNKKIDENENINSKRLKNIANASENGI